MLTIYFLITIISLSQGSFVNKYNQSVTLNNAPCVCVGGHELINSTSYCLYDCNGNRRLSNELDCVFPFYYNSVWHDTCIMNDRNTWCSLDRVFSKKIANCEQFCPLIARKRVNNTINAVHTACLSKPNGTIAYPANSDQINLIVQTHNNFRSNVSPKSKGMRSLTWDFSLARLAQKWAEEPLFKHDCLFCRSLLDNKTSISGQNLYQSATFGSNLSLAQLNWHWNNSVQLWYDEVKDFIYSVGAKKNGIKQLFL